MDELGEPAAGPDRLHVVRACGHRDARRAWGIPAVYFSRRKPGGDRAGLACLLSMAACAGALFLQVLYNKHLVELQDWSALMDTSGAVAWVSALLLAVTLILDLFCLWAEGKLNGEERGKGGPEEPEIRREA